MMCRGTVWEIDDTERTAKVSLAANYYREDTVLAFWTTRPTLEQTVTVAIGDGSAVIV